MPAPSTNNSRERLLNTVRFISEHPHQAAWRALLPFSVFGASGFGAANQRDENLYRILFFLSLMGARESIHRLNTHLKTQTKEHDVVKNVYESLCELVDDICSARDDKGELLWPRSVVKRLRKNLHDYARNNGFETRVVNIRDIAEGSLARKELARVREEASKKLLEKNLAATQREKTSAENEAEFDFDAQQFIVKLRQDKYEAITQRAITIEQELTGSDQKLTKPSHYRVIKKELNDAQQNHLDALNFFAEQKHKANRFVHKSTNPGEKSDALAIEQEKKRSIKNGIAVSALVISLVVCFGEAVVPFMLSGATGPLGWLILIGGFAVNFYLFGGAAQGTMRTLFLGKLFHDGKGVEVSRNTKIAIVLSLLSCIGSGVVYGCLSFSQLLPFFMVKLGLVGALPYVLAGWIAGATAIAILALFFISFSKVIKPEGRAQLRNHFDTTYVQVWQQTQGLDCAIRLISNLLADLLTFALSVFVLISMVAFFQTKALQMFEKTWQLAAPISSILATVFNGLAFLPNAIFSIESQALVGSFLLSTVPMVCRAIVAFVSDPIGCCRHIRQSLSNNAISAWVKLGSFFMRSLLFVGAVANGYGQALGPYNDQRVKSFSSLGGLLKGDAAQASRVACTASAFTYSVAPNMASVNDKLETPATCESLRVVKSNQSWENKFQFFRSTSESTQPSVAPAVTSAPAN